MTKRLKDLLLAIAKQPLVDERWIVKHLPEDQRIKFERRNGHAQLKEARRFRALRPVAPKERTHLPSDCQLLRQKPALYIAIILEQGLYPWQAEFLTQFDTDKKIQQALAQQVPAIKPLVKHAVFTDWQRMQENIHG
jgi:hypothetical protein